MNIYLDTATEDFVIFLFDDNFKVIDYSLLKGYKKKVDLIISQYQDILSRNNLETTSINAFYTNIGPGFFTGVRSSLVFCRTIAMSLNKKLFYCDTFSILKKQTKEENLYLDAQGLMVYEYKSKENKINVVKKIREPHKVNYDLMIKNFNDYKDIFLSKDNLIEIEPLYIKKPQIGGL